SPSTRREIRRLPCSAAKSRPMASNASPLELPLGVMYALACSPSAQRKIVLAGMSEYRSAPSGLQIGPSVNMCPSAISSSSPSTTSSSDCGGSSGAPVVPVVVVATSVVLPGSLVVVGAVVVVVGAVVVGAVVVVVGAV